MECSGKTTVNLLPALQVTPTIDLLPSGELHVGC
jgi:hypothetical protein